MHGGRCEPTCRTGAGSAAAARELSEGFLRRVFRVRTVADDAKSDRCDADVFRDEEPVERAVVGKDIRGYHAPLPVPVPLIRYT